MKAIIFTTDKCVGAIEKSLFAQYLYELEICPITMAIIEGTEAGLNELFRRSIDCPEAFVEEIYELFEEEGFTYNMN